MDLIQKYQNKGFFYQNIQSLKIFLKVLKIDFFFHIIWNKSMKVLILVVEGNFNGKSNVFIPAYLF